MEANIQDMEKQKKVKRMFSVRVKDETLELLNEYAEETGISKGRIVENALDEYINSRKLQKDLKGKGLYWYMDV